MTSPAGLIARLLAPKIHVSATNIFARMIEPDRQALAYGMTVSSTIEVAMVLPLPVAPGRGEDAVRFLDLSSHPLMFSELANLFEMMLAAPKGGSMRSLSMPRTKLVVHDVGSFIASYVPSRADFTRLDERFRMPDVLFDHVPHYADYGFAVFQLKPGTVTVHPMGLSFPTRDPSKLYFPTVHLHDGRWSKKATFDHALYYQRPTKPYAQGDDVILRHPGSSGEVEAWMRPNKTYDGLVSPELFMLRQKIRGRRPNADTWL